MLYFTQYNVYPPFFMELDTSLKTGIDMAYRLIQQGAAQSGVVVNDLYDRLNTINGNYKLMLRSMVMNFDDPQRSEMSQKLKKDLVNVLTRLTARIYRQMPMSATAHEQQRVSRLAPLTAEQWDTLRLELSDKGTTHGEHKAFDDKLKLLYDNIAFADELTTTQLTGVQHIIDDTHCCSEARQLAVSALTINSLRYININVLNLLVDAATYYTELRARALVGIAFNIFVYYPVLSWYPEFSEGALKLLLETDGVKETLMIIYRLVVMCQSSERVSGQIEKEFGSAIRMFMNNAKDKTADEEHQKTQDTPEWLQRVENSVSDNIESIVQLCSEGYDIHYSAFKKTALLPYWRDEYHWFTPFYVQDPAFDSYFFGNAGFVKAMVTEPYFSDTQCKGLLNQFASLPQSLINNIREQVEKQVGSELLQDSGDSLDAYLDARYKDTDKCIMFYIHDLYRFASLYLNRADKFTGTVPEVLQQGVVPTLMPFDTDVLFKRLADFLRQDLGDAANHDEELLTSLFSLVKVLIFDIRIFVNEMSDDFMTVDRLKQIGYLLQQIKLSGADDYYCRAEMLQRNDPWILKRLFECYVDGADPMQAITVYERLCDLFLPTDEIDLVAAEVYFEVEEYDQSLECCNKVLKRDRTSHDAGLMALKCLMKQGDIESAERQSELQVTGPEAGGEDYMFAGHFALTGGNRLLALEYYRSAYRHCIAKSKKDGTCAEEEFTIMFDEISEFFEDFPLSKEEATCLCDAAMYDEL